MKNIFVYKPSVFFSPSFLLSFLLSLHIFRDPLSRAISPTLHRESNRRAWKMETVEEDKEYSWREVTLPQLIPRLTEPELERENFGERRRGRSIIVAVDHGPNSKHAFHWALVHLCRLADTLHLVHAVSSI